jgi:NhaP-type Na+/H+ and K+/H+ antiporter
MKDIAFIILLIAFVVQSVNVSNLNKKLDLAMEGIKYAFDICEKSSNEAEYKIVHASIQKSNPKNNH